MEMGWNLPMLQGQHRFDHPSNAGCALQMAKIGLYRANPQGGGAFAENCIERPNFNWVAQGGAGAMGFNVTDLLRIHACLL